MIKEGDKIPAGSLKKMGKEGPEIVDMADYCKGRIVLFAVPGAFTPTCSAKHVPGFLAHIDEIKAKGVDKIACMSVNDVFVMGAWAQDQNTGDKIDMLADGSGDFTKALGLELDLTKAGLGVRSQRFAMIIDDGIVSHLAIDEGGAFKLSSAESILSALN